MMVDINVFVVLVVAVALFGPQLGVQGLTCICNANIPGCTDGTMVCTGPNPKCMEVDPPVGPTMRGCTSSEKAGCTQQPGGKTCLCDTDNCNSTPTIPTTLPTTKIPGGDGGAVSDGRTLRSSWSFALLVIVSSVIVVVPPFVGGQ